VDIDARFLSHYGRRGEASGLRPGPALRAALEAFLTAARQPWPEPLVDDDLFLRHAAERLPAGEDPATLLPGLHASDLYLACACALEQPRALAFFESRVLPHVARPLAARGFRDTIVEEVKQAIRSRFLVADASGRKRIAEYTGRAPLVAWLRTAALRLAVNMRVAEAGRREVSSDHLLPELAAAPDPELALLKSHFAREFRAAFETTLAALPPREGNVLRLHYLEGMTFVAIAALYRVTTRTIRRWIADVKVRIVTETERQLRARGQLTASGLDGVMGVLRSHLDLTLSRFFLESKSDGASEP
jgi:RNA polymerase sigma-70 factor (ECF subfamily)